MFTDFSKIEVNTILRQNLRKQYQKAYTNNFCKAKLNFLQSSVKLSNFYGMIFRKTKEDGRDQQVSTKVLSLSPIFLAILSLYNSSPLLSSPPCSFTLSPRPFTRQRVVLR